MYRIDVVSIGILFFISYIVVDLFRNRTRGLVKRLVFYSFIFYLLNVLQVTTGGIHLPPVEEYRIVTFQIIPFRFLLDWVEMYKFRGVDWFFWNSVKLSLYNFIMLLPLGIYLPVLFNINIKKVALYTMLASLTIEVYQVILTYFGLILLRTANVDDIILNTFGGIIGYCIYKIALSQWIHKVIKN